jgi:two-component system, cell cycle sensor histidine kinase and response regulator CckA
LSTPTILVVEDNPITRKMLRVTLETERFAVLEAPDGATALGLLEKQLPALVLQDFVLPDMTGAELLKRIRSLHDAQTLPVILLTGLASKTAEFEQGGGFTTVLSKPVEPSQLVEVVQSVIASPDAPAPAARLPARRVLVVDDDAGNRKLADARLHLVGYRPTVVASVEDALREARRERPDVILGDVLMPGLDGYQLCLAARRDPALATVPIVLVSSAYTEESDRKLALLVGASDLVLRTPGYEHAVTAIEAACAPGAAAPRQSGVALDQEYLASLRRQVDRQMAHNQELARRAGIQAAALSMVGALAQALANPREVTAVLGDVLVHCLDAAGLSTGILYLRAPDGTLRVHSMAGIPDVLRGEAERAFGQAALLERGKGDAPVALNGSGGDPAHRDFLARLKRRSALVVPFVVLGQHYGTLLLASDAHDLGDAAWGTFARALAAQFGQAVALGRSLAQLAESDALLRSAVEASPNGMVMSDAQGRIVMVNRQIERMFGYGEGELAGRQLETLLPPRHRAAHLGHRATFHADPQQRPMGARRELFGLHKSGREVPVEIGLAPVKRGDETFVIASVVDITERKRAQEQLQWLSLAMEQGPTSVIMTNLDGTIEYVNPKFTEVTGYTLDDVRGKNPRLLKSGNTPPDVYRDLWATITAGRPWHGEIENRKKDGSAYWDSMWVYPVRDAKGSVTRFLALKEDVTEQRSLEHQLRQAQKMEAVGRLAGGVAHDFNNVLTAIFGYADLVADEFPADSPQRADVAEIRKAAHRAAGLTRQLLAFSRQQILEPVVLSLNDLVEDIDKMITRLVGEDVELRLALTPDAGNVRADPGQLQQVIMNLVVNARDAMPTGGKLLIETANADLSEQYAELHQPVVPGRYVLLAVSDTGMGMSAETRARIFEPFFTTKEKGKGTGLGLSTVYGIVKQSGGYVWVYSEPGRGTTFKVYLPRVDAAAEEPLRPREGGTIAGTETILLAEDDDMLRPLAKGLLEKLGYKVLEARNAEEALATARDRSGPIHLLVADVVMPGRSGRELARQLAETRPATKVLYVSGYTDDAIVHHGMLEPGLHFLQKPFTPAVLARKVREVLDAQ